MDCTFVNHKEETRFRQSWPWWRCVLTGLTAVALALSAYLSWHHLVGGSAIGCGGGSPCDQVLSSRWSSVGGVLPVSGLAAGVYLAMLVAGLFIGPATEAPVRRLAWGAMLILVGAAAGSAVWFIIVQKWIIGAFCPYCMAAHTTGLVLAALVLWRAPSQFGNSSTDSGSETADGGAGIHRDSAVQSEPRGQESWSGRSCVRPAAPRRSMALVGLALAGFLAACQVGFTPPPAYRSGESQQSQPTFDPHDVPLVGSPDAAYVIMSLFDYKCPHCQQLHFMLDEAVSRYGGKVAFALCPAPLETRCNSYIPRDVEEFKDSCELAKVSLAVWLAKREAFPAFDRWLFSFESGDRWHPRSIEAARAKAIELVGKAEFDAAAADPWVDRHLQTSIRLYGDTTRSGNGAIPKMVFGSRWVVPQPNNADDLVMILHDSLAVPAP